MEAALGLGVENRMPGHMHSTQYMQVSSSQRSNDSTDFDRTSLSSSPSTQASSSERGAYLSLTSSTINGHIRKRRSSRSKRGSCRLSSSISVLPSFPVNKTVVDAKCSSQSKHAQRLNDSMVYLDGPNVYSCGNCRTHLTSHDDIISKSFHGRHGRAYLFNTCVNVTKGPSEQRRLITGIHTVCDIFCKRCETLVGWTYLKAHESSQKYKEGRFIVEKINLYAEQQESNDGSIVFHHPISSSSRRHKDWGDEDVVFEYVEAGSNSMS